MRLFHKKIISEEEKERRKENAEIKKFPKKRQKKLRELLTLYKEGKMLRPGEDIDNKEFLAGRF
jgi:hypothetical protein